jgi:hypothetical protein
MRRIVGRVVILVSQGIFLISYSFNNIGASGLLLIYVYNVLHILAGQDKIYVIRGT